MASSTFSHWDHLIEGSDATPLEFYKTVEEAIERRKIPDSSRSRIDYREYGYHRKLSDWRDDDPHPIRHDVTRESREMVLSLPSWRGAKRDCHAATDCGFPIVSAPSFSGTNRSVARLSASSLDPANSFTSATVTARYFIDCSFSSTDFVTNGYDVMIMMMVSGSRKNA